MIFTLPGPYCGHGSPNAVDIRFFNATDPGNLQVSGSMDFKLMARLFELLAEMTDGKAAC